MTRRYRAVAFRSGKWWAIEFPDDDRVHSQARRIDQVSTMAAEALSLWLGVDVAAEDVDVEVQAGPLDPVIARAVEARREADAARERATGAMREAVVRAVDAGLPLRDVGRLLGVTHQRAAAIAREARASARAA